MEKSKRFKFNPNFKKIIFCAVMVIAMTALYVIPFSAAGFEPVEFSSLALKGLFLYSDFSVGIYNSTDSIKTFYFNKSTSTSVNPVSSTDELHVVQYQGNLLFDVDSFVFDQNAYYSKYYLYSISQDNYGSSSLTNGRSSFTLRFYLDFPINLYLYDTSLKFYVILPSTSDCSCTFSGAYIDSDEQPHAINTSNSLLVTNKMPKEFISSNSILNDNFKSVYSGNYVSTSVSRKLISYINQDLTYTTWNNFPNRQLTMYEVSLNFGQDYYDVSSVYFQVNMNMNNGINNLPVYCEFDTSQPLTFYEYVDDSSSVDLSYIEDMLDSIGGQLEVVNDKLDEITGEPSSENQQQQAILQEVSSDAIAEIDEALSEWRRAEEMPTLPFDQQTQRIPIPENGELDSYNGFFYTFFTQFPLVQQIITSGCVCLIFYVLFRRV